MKEHSQHRTVEGNLRKMNLTWRKNRESSKKPLSGLALGGAGLNCEHIYCIILLCVLNE